MNNAYYHRNTTVMLPLHIKVGLRQSVDATLVIGSPYVLGFMVAIWFYVGLMVLDTLSMENFSKLEKNPEHRLTNYHQ